MSEFLRQAEFIEEYNNSPHHSETELANDDVITLTLSPDSLYEGNYEQCLRTTESNEDTRDVIATEAKTSPSLAGQQARLTDKLNNSSPPLVENQCVNDDVVIISQTRTLYLMRCNPLSLHPLRAIMMTVHRIRKTSMQKMGTPVCPSLLFPLQMLFSAVSPLSATWS